MGEQVVEDLEPALVQEVDSSSQRGRTSKKWMSFSSLSDQVQKLKGQECTVERSTVAARSREK